MDQMVIPEIRGHIAVVTINRPQALNALNAELLKQLSETLDALDANREVRAIILTGSGNKAFVAGADIAEMRDMTPDEAKRFGSLGQSVMSRISGMRAIIIAAVNGYALGGGCELAMACDIRVASSKAKMGLPEVTLGIIPGFGGTQRLARLIGTGRALELMATGKQITAEEGVRIGLVNHMTEPDDLLPYCETLAGKIAANSTSAIALGKQSVYSGYEMDISRGLEYEASLFGLTFADPDQKEGMTAFLEKRKAEFGV